MKQKLLNWIKQASDSQIKETGTTRAYLKQIAYGHKPANPLVSARLENVTDGLVTRPELRPDDWSEIWPELNKAAS